MRILAILFLMTYFLKCSNKQAHTIENSGETEQKEKAQMIISAINAKFPLRLGEVQFESKEHFVHLNDGISAKIEQTINDCANENCFTYNDIYINTIQLQYSLYTLFVVLLKHFPTNAINSKILFYNNLTKEFIDKTIDFNLHALYDYENGKFIPSNLKRGFKINSPEIELINENNDGISNYKFTKLFHNGTFNAIQTTVLTIKNSQIEMLQIRKKIIGIGNENKN